MQKSSPNAAFTFHFPALSKQEHNIAYVNFPQTICIPGPVKLSHIILSSLSIGLKSGFGIQTCLLYAQKTCFLSLNEHIDNVLFFASIF